MERGKSDEYFTFKMRQARDAYRDAEGLLEDGAELRYVANSIFYAFYYPVILCLRF